MSFEIVFVMVALMGMVCALIWDKMRPGMILLSVCVAFLCVGILTPKEMLEGFSNKGMITVAMLFLVSEGVRQSGALSHVIKKILPQENTTIFKAQLRMLPSIAFISAFLNNTPVVVIFAPIIKRWARSVQLSATKFLIPLSYMTILGGLCTLIGTSTNLVVHGMMIEAGFKGLGMFDLAWVGLPITLVGALYIFLASKKLLPDERNNTGISEDELDMEDDRHQVEVVIGPRFPGINKTLKEFNFRRHYGAEVREIKRNGKVISSGFGKETMCEGDTLVLMADESFVKTWGDSSVFLMIANGEDVEPQAGKKKRLFALVLLLMMIIGATIGELPFFNEHFPSLKLDMFFFASVTMVIMAWTNLFPARKYTKYISWDILITIACAFAISKAMTNSGLADLIAKSFIDVSTHFSTGSQIGPYILLGLLYLISNIITALITNNAAAALCFPLALSIASQLGVNPMPFFIAICVSASADFSTPIGYQTNLIVQGIGNYKFMDFVRIGVPLNLLCLLISVIIIPLVWPFELI